MTAAEQFHDLVRSSSPSLAEGCLVIAEHLNEPVGLAPGLVLLDDLTAEVEERVADGPRRPSLDDVARALVVHGRFQGDHANYYDPRNSMLGDVLRRRKGIPITLSIVVIEVAGRLGVPASGVGMPGHFLVGDGPVPTRWLDAFDGATWLDQRMAATRFASIHGPAASFDPAFLRPTPPPQILGRVLNNLAGTYRAQGDPTRLLRVVELRADIPGMSQSPRTQVELAESLVAVGRCSDAIVVLERLISRVDPRRRDALRARVELLRRSQN